MNDYCSSTSQNEYRNLLEHDVVNLFDDDVVPITDDDDDDVVVADGGESTRRDAEDFDVETRRQAISTWSQSISGTVCIESDDQNE